VVVVLPPLFLPRCVPLLLQALSKEETSKAKGERTALRHGRRIISSPSSTQCGG
jgi:hypothetical protein